MANTRTPVVLSPYTTGSVANLSTTRKAGSYSNNFISLTNWWVADKPLLPADSDFTLEFWHHQLTTTDRAKFYCLFRQVSGAAQVGIIVQNGYYRLRVQTTTGYSYNYDSVIPAATAWTHVALVRSNNVFKFYLNGDLKFTSTTIIGSIPQVNSSIGGGYTGLTSNTSTVARLIDEFRVSSIARYNANSFTPQAAFSNDTNTLALFHMENIPPVDDATLYVDLVPTTLSSVFSMVTNASVVEYIGAYQSIQTNLFVDIDIPDYQMITFSDYHKNYTIGSITYQGLGNLLAITDNASSLRATPDDVSITISGIPTSNVTEILNNKIKGSVVNIRRGFFDPTTAKLLSVTPNPIGKFQGIVSNFDITDDLESGSSTGSVTLTLTLTSVVELLTDKISGRRTNSRDFSDDKSMDRVALLSKSNFNFGAPK